MKKRVKQILGAVCLVSAIATTLVPASLVNAISTGMDFEKDGDKLISYTGTASAVSVPAGIKTICAEAFAGNSAIKSVSFPESLEKIENGAFRNCVNLESVTIGNGVTEIGSGAFAMCENLQKVCFSDTVLSLGAGVFAGDDQLKTIDVGNNPYFVCANGVLYNRDKTKLIQYLSAGHTERFVMPDSVTDVERYAFWGCSDLEDVVLSAGLYMIPEYAFSNCKDLRSVSIPYSVRKIGAKAFENCERLGNVDIPASVTTIHETAFDGCSRVRILAKEGTCAYEFYQNWKQTYQNQENQSVSGNSGVSLYDGGKDGDRTSEEPNDLASDSTAESTEESTAESTADDGSAKGQYDLRNPADVSDLHVSEYYADDAKDVIGKVRIVANQAVILPDKADVSQAVDGTEQQTDTFTPQMTISDTGSHVIVKKAYYQSDTLQGVCLENGFTDIDDLAFARSSLTGITIPEGVTHIGYGAFYHCDALSVVSIPSTVTDIEPEAFARTPYLENWLTGEDQEDFLVVGDGILIAYKGDSGVVQIPQNVKKIAGGTFRDHTEIYKVEWDDSLTEIGEDAFAGCIGLTSVSSMGHVRKIADRAFGGCPLSQIHIGNDCKWIGVGAFDGNAAGSITFESIQELPSLSYEQTAMRYENADYRISPFGDLTVAVVSDSLSDFTDTVLDEDYLGFRGLVVSLPNGTEDANAIAKLEYCTLLPAPGEENVKVPSFVRIDGKSYTITEADQDAFLPYTRLDAWAQQKVSAVLLPQALGNLTDYEPDLVLGNPMSESVQETAQEAASTDDNTENDADFAQQKETKTQVQTICLASDYDYAGNITATVSDDESAYKLFINQSAEERDLQDAVEDEFGPTVAGQLYTFDLKLVEKATNIPINSFGQGQVEVCVPISETMYGQQICAVSLAQDQSLELIYGAKSENADGYTFSFRTDHFSPYGIYAGIGAAAQTIKEGTDALERQDESPDTGETFDPRFLLVIAFGCLGILLLINGRKRI